MTSRFNSFVALDLETTGFDPATEKIIEAAAVRFENGVETDSFTRLVNPGKAVPPAVQRLTGIDPADLEPAPTWEQVRDEFFEFLGRGPAVAHNLGFDWTFLRHHGGVPDIELVDTLELSVLLQPHAPAHKLESLIGFLELDASASHRSLDDSRACGLLFLRLLEELASLDAGFLGGIVDLMDDPAWLPRAVFMAALDEPRGAAQLDIFASEPGRAAPSPDLKPPDLKPAHGEFDLAREAADAFSPGGALSRMPGYEHRESQARMSESVARSVAANRHLMIEVPPGVGKSLAYLVPAALWARARNRPVPVSTYTRSLQDQLVQNDLPLLRNCLGADLRFCAVKGRNNYVCARRARTLLSGAPPQGLERAWIFLKLWLRGSGTGELESIPIWPLRQYSGLEQTVDRLRARADDCSGSDCEAAAGCFVLGARARARSSHIVVVNHALLFAEKLGYAGADILPETDWAVIDEAHNLEAAATDALTQTVSGFELEFAAGRIQAAAAASEDKLGGTGLGAPISSLVAESRRFLADLGPGAASAFRGLEPEPDSRFPANILLERKGRIGAVAGWLEQVGDDLAGLAEKTSRIAVDPILTSLPALKSLWTREADRMGRLAGILRRGLEPDAGRGAWIVLGRSSPPEWSFHSAPIRVGPELEEFWSSAGCLVMTSATLTVRRRFDFILDRLGLYDVKDQGRLELERLASPFDLKRRLMLLLPTDNPTPPAAGSGGRDRHMAQTAQRLVDLIHAAGGGAMALFNSWKDLNEIAERAGPELERLGYEFMVQDRSTGRALLARQFRDERDSVLFGVRSFWEGVDVPGPSLRLVVLVKLPFGYFHEPIMVYRQRALSKEGRSDFRDLTLPLAVLSFTQGVGRLIRSKDDFGAVAVLDQRMLGKSYGSIFLESLPPHHESRKPLAELVADLPAFLDKP